MSRQLSTLILGAVLCLAMAVGSFSFRVPYVVLSPGPTFNTLGKYGGNDIISINGHAVSQTSGNLNLTTVSEDTQNATVASAIKGWLRHDEVVVPHDSVNPPGLTQQQVTEQDKQDFVQSQNSAIAAAACELKYPKGFGILDVASDSPNLKVLEPGDSFVSLNNTKVTDDPSLRAVIAKLKPGDKVPAVLIRAGKEISVTVTLGAPGSAGGPPLLGISLTNGCLLPFEVAVDLGGIGGPSAGLMFSLGLIDKLGTEDLTHGKFIAGTGTIDPDGAVGPIGGIQLKMIGARRAGATVFLAPSSNCSDVRGNIPSGLNVVKVTSLKDAIDSLNALGAGQTTVPRC